MKHRNSLWSAREQRRRQEPVPPSLSSPVTPPGGPPPHLSKAASTSALYSAVVHSLGSSGLRCGGAFHALVPLYLSIGCVMARCPVKRVHGSGLFMAGIPVRSQATHHSHHVSPSRKHNSRCQRAIKTTRIIHIDLNG